MSRVASKSGPAGLVSPSGINQPDEIVGTWLNTNAESPAIVKAVLESTDNGLTVRVYGIDNGAKVDWGQAPVAAYGSAENLWKSVVSKPD